jgi:hypothetical protein
MNIIFWKTNWDFGADGRGIVDISNLSHGIEPQRIEFSVGPAVGVRLWWSNWFLVGVHPKNIYCILVLWKEKRDKNWKHNRPESFEFRSFPFWVVQPELSLLCRVKILSQLKTFLGATLITNFNWNQ